MRRNILFFPILMALCCLLLLCERSDVLTGAGSGVVWSMDSTLTDTKLGFALITLGGAGAINSAFSLPAAPDPAFSTQAAVGYMLAGINRDGDTLAAHAQFRVSPFRTDPNKTPYGEDYEDYRDSLQAFLFFRAADTISASDQITVYRSDTLYGLRPKPVNRAHGGSIGTFTLGATANSLELPPNITDSILNARVSADTSNYFDFAVSIVDYYGDLRKIHNPFVVVVVNNGEQTVRDTIRGGFTRFTAFENAGDGRDTLPYSSQHTMRTAVFVINAQPVLDTLEKRGISGGGNELLSAVFVLKPHGGANVCNAETNPLTSNCVGSYKFAVSDMLITNEVPAGDSDADIAGSLFGQFGSVSSTTPRQPYNAHGPSAVRNALRSVVDGSNRDAHPYIYVYLRPVAENSMILWDKPSLRFETIFTPSRSQ